MLAEIISIGDELISGQSLDTNSQWLSRRLNELGIPVVAHTTVGDQLTSIVHAMHAAAARAQLVLVTGGLGPTADDLTRQAVADVTQQPLELHPPSLEHIQKLFRRRGKQMPERNVLQAYLPRGAAAVDNPEGTAPGIHVSLQRPEGTTCRIVCLPGVPAEMRPMWYTSIEPILRTAVVASKTIFHHVVRCFGVGESEVESRLPPELLARHRDPLVGITASGATISLRISTAVECEAEFRAKIKPTVDAICQHLGDLVFGENDQQLQHIVLQLLADRQMTLGIVDCGLHGLPGRWLLQADPQQRSIRGCISLADSGSARWYAQHYQIDTGTDETARSIRREFGTDLGLAVGSMPELAPIDSSLYLKAALATPEDLFSWQLPLASHPQLVKTRAAKLVLNQLRLYLSNRLG